MPDADRDAFIDAGLKAFAEDPLNRDRTLLALAWQLQQLEAALAPILALAGNPKMMEQAGRLAGMAGGFFGGR